MNCWHCNTKLIWGGDHDIEDHEDYEMVTNLHCPKCNSYVEVYLPKQQIKKKGNVYEFKPNNERKKD